MDLARSCTAHLVALQTSEDESMFQDQGICNILGSNVIVCIPCVITLRLGI